MDEACRIGVLLFALIVWPSILAHIALGDPSPIVPACATARQEGGDE